MKGFLRTLSRPTKYSAVVFVLIIAAALIGPHSQAHAQAAGGTLESIIDAFLQQAKAWEAVLLRISTLLFVSLALIDMIWVIGWRIRKGDIGDLIEVVVQEMVTLGLFYWLLTNSAAFMLAIIESFGLAANSASLAGGGSANLGPTGIFTAGMNLTKIIWDGMSIAAPGESFVLAIGGFTALWIFAQMAGALIEVLVESYLAAYGGIIMMGFGGVWVTRDLAINQYRYAISVGAKRFFLQLIVGLTEGIMTNLTQKVAADGVRGGVAIDWHTGNVANAMNWQLLGMLIGIPIVLWRLADNVPGRVQNMINGTHVSAAGNPVSTAARVAAAAAGAAASLTGAGAAVGAAVSQAQEQISARSQQGQQNGQSPPGRMAQAAMTAGYAARNFGSALAGDIGQRLSGQGGRHGSRGFRMAAGMKNRNSNRNP